MIRPSLALIVIINTSVRDSDEFFDDEDDLDRVERVLQASENISDPILLAGLLMSRLARSQAFTEGNKRTAPALKQAKKGGPPLPGDWLWRQGGPIEGRIGLLRR